MIDTKLAVGSTIYGFGIRGQRIGELFIVGETRVSWIISEIADAKAGDWSCSKISKKDLASGELYGYKATRKEAEDKLWLVDNRWRIAQRVDVCDKPAVLRQIAELIGYKEQQ